MKLRKVVDVCVKSGRVELRRAPGCQWVGNGGAQYAFYSLPVLTEDNAPTLFDIPSEKAQMVQVIPGCPSLLCDVYEEEVPIERDLNASRYCPDGLVPFSGRTGLIFIKRKYLTPFKDDDRVSFFERCGCIAVKVGMTLCAVIAPYRVINDEYLDGLSDYLEDCRKTAEFGKSDEDIEE